MKAVIYMYEKVLLTEEEIAEDTGISLRRVRKIIRRYLNGVAISKNIKIVVDTTLFFV